jgi:hypothetical protein
MVVEYAKLPNQHFPFYGPSKFTQTGILCLKIYHAATLIERTFYQLVA